MAPLVDGQLGEREAGALHQDMPLVEADQNAVRRESRLREDAKDQRLERLQALEGRLCLGRDLNDPTGLQMFIHDHEIRTVGPARRCDRQIAVPVGGRRTPVRGSAGSAMAGGRCRVGPGGVVLAAAKLVWGLRGIEDEDQARTDKPGLIQGRS
ncbi:hypothetical protein GCM10010365_71800 [Streptomyces poonensis]|uniref:Uncharacterized protein n=1 Tax=Streptomyces poonensis TaxID=68255 RepID=A0A918QC54_9ACTN|nr:hypothetical protein GCM10010365_71800 [Streptomyces poonensis]GLJ93057.1 hypothetical protein GCM10017589_56690 [Streptomyces poonensis]